MREWGAGWRLLGSPRPVRAAEHIVWRLVVAGVARRGWLAGVAVSTAAAVVAALAGSVVSAPAAQASPASAVALMARAGAPVLSRGLGVRPLRQAGSVVVAGGLLDGMSSDASSVRVAADGRGVVLSAVAADPDVGAGEVLDPREAGSVIQFTVLWTSPRTV